MIVSSHDKQHDISMQINFLIEAIAFQRGIIRCSFSSSYWFMKWIFHVMRYYSLSKWIIALGFVSLLNIVLHINQCEKLFWLTSMFHQTEIWINIWFTFVQESYFYSDLAKRMRDFVADSSSSEYELLGWVIKMKWFFRWRGDGIWGRSSS